MPEEKSSKGISLRRKKTTRPNISAPKQISRDPSADSRNNSLFQTQTNDSSNTNLTVPGARPRLGSNDTTADLVKRRYSTRFTGGLPQDGLTPPVPALPHMPAQYARGDSRSPSRDGRSPERGGGKLRVDGRALKDPNLQADRYVASALQDASESDIHTFQADLQNLKAHTSTDLQHNVYQNRTQFIKISKEADKLKTEMRTLRSLMSELTGALGHATSAGGGESVSSLADRKRANRTSVANLEALWQTNLQALWKRIEGSQKYLPAIPGRHVKHESTRWMELNAATWKPRRRCTLILLNDYFLVATEKKRPDLGASPNAKNNRQSMYINPKTETQWVAERCWPLQDVLMSDISTRGSASIGHSHSNAISNAINVRVGTESMTFCPITHNDTYEKPTMLVEYRKAVEDLRKNMAVEHSEREKAMDELAFLTGNARLLKKAEPLEGAMPNRSSTLIDVDGRQQSLRWVESQIDGLDIDIALQRFEEAVARTEKLRKLARSVKGNQTAQEIILIKVNERATKLANLIARRLVQTNTQMGATKENCAWIGRLGFEEMARERYLEARTLTIRKRTR